MTVSSAKCTKTLSEEKLTVVDSLIDSLLRDCKEAFLLVKQVRVTRLEHSSAHMLAVLSKRHGWRYLSITFTSIAGNYMNPAKQK